jgi:hypothetical protein
MALTPGIAAALAVSMRLILARAWGLFLSWAWSMPGSTMSLTKVASPVSFSTMSGRPAFCPT